MMARNLVVFSLAVMLGLTAGAGRLCAADLACLTCHSAPGFREAGIEGKEKSLYVDADLLAVSAHKGKKCVDCHADFQGQKMPHKQSPEPVKCARCHHDGNRVGAPDHSHIEMYADSVHGNALRKGDPDAPTCKTCHGTHDIRPPSNSKSSVCRENVPKTCGRCHFDFAFNERHKLASVKSFTDSVHARVAVLNNGLNTAAVCTDCHGLHDIRPPDELPSSVSRSSVPIRAKCHKDVLKQYEVSIQQGRAKGVKRPVCTDCTVTPDNGAFAASHRSTRTSWLRGKCHNNIIFSANTACPLTDYPHINHLRRQQVWGHYRRELLHLSRAHDVLPSASKSAISKKNLRRHGEIPEQELPVGSIHAVRRQARCHRVLGIVYMLWSG